MQSSLVDYIQQLDHRNGVDIVHEAQSAQIHTAGRLVLRSSLMHCGHAGLREHNVDSPVYEIEQSVQEHKFGIYRSHALPAHIHS